MNNKSCNADLFLDNLPNIEEMPGELRAVAEVIGVEKTIKLSQEFRGCSIYIHSIDHLLRKKRNIKIRANYDSGIAVNLLARKYRLSARQIENILNSVDG